MPLVSFVVPVYNAEKTIEHCIRSLQEQSVRDIEILIVNDGSFDNSLSICNLLSQTDPRIRVFNQENLGVSAARNKGIENAFGTYVSFVDADDWIDPNACEVLASNLKMVDYDLFCFSAVYSKKNKNNATRLFAKDIQLLSQTEREKLFFKVLTPWIPSIAQSSCAKFYKHNLLLQMGTKFKEGAVISEDTLFVIQNFRLFRKIGYSTQSNYHYMQHSNSAQNAYRANSRDQFKKVIVEIKKELRANPSDINLYNSMNTLFVHYIFGILKEDIFHKDNPFSIKNKKQQLINVIEDQIYIEALNNVSWSCFTLPEKILILLIKKKMFFIIYFLMKFVR